MCLRCLMQKPKEKQCVAPMAEGPANQLVNIIEHSSGPSLMLPICLAIVLGVRSAYYCIRSWELCVIAVFVAKSAMQMIIIIHHVNIMLHLFACKRNVDQQQQQQQHHWKHTRSHFSTFAAGRVVACPAGWACANGC